MVIHAKEIMEPEELSQLGVVFEDAWAAVRASAGDSDEHRATLATILLRLAHLSQLGPNQMKATAIRMFGSELHNRSGANDATSSAPIASASLDA